MPKGKKLALDNKLLFELYWSENMNCRQIAELLGISNEATIRHYFHRNDIPLRQKSDAFKLAENSGRYNKERVPWNAGIKGAQIAWNRLEINISKEDFVKLYYHEQKTLKQIADIYQTTVGIIFRRMNEQGILRRTMKNACIIRSRDNLEWKQKLSKARLGKPAWNKGKKCWWRSSTVFKKGHKLTANTFKTMQSEPNKSEKALICIFEKHSIPFKFVGNGELVIDGYCPDFICTTNPIKLIELFGVYWHGKDGKRKNMPYHQTEKGRKELFAKFGYETLVIWEDELPKEEEVIRRIKNFIKEN